ncbi:efflux RND transporter periplasmic adaptor subunit [Aporhodopirellula aestuarii]|uniref:Efflux RND transporter periplasmic adaptor subunit n=1 Tax=Aporhodopirellula aestuarii TaxID=2950107 RepID=A0ABT0UBE8_9BACT|nr:efflux RND transporter periplasmic adaptor subunit [Aporhodopirellula aestuarii]MCM2374106.1 efflux RND transporter periplasmic adaptor subunit [Aporhodopirellula aestuarii]
MSIKTTAPAEADHVKPGVMQSLTRFGPTLFVLAVMGVGWLAVHEINTSGVSDEEPAEAEASSPNVIVLPAGKLNAAKLVSMPAGIHPVKHVHTIPGRIRYDETKHVDVKAPMDGILAEVLITPGEDVECGQLIAVLRSTEIGRARAEILKRQKQLEIAQQVLQREVTLARNMSDLSVRLDEGQPVEVIEEAFRGLSLGRYRQDILSAYGKKQLAAELLDKIQPLADSGSVSGRTIRERQAERQLAETEFRTARDQATYEVNQALMIAEGDVAEANRQLDLAWQAVESLLGYKEDRSSVVLNDVESLSRLEVRAPLSGTVESRAFANNERVSRGDSLIVLADTKSLYVAANIRESDWSAVSLAEGTPVSVMIPALNDRVFEARIRYFGREVQADTNSVPLIATIQNNEHLLRPGMFVRVTIPIGESREALSVKPESVVQHENQSFVFVTTDDRAFQRVDVSTGQASDDWVEVTEGLRPGQLVVTEGAFLLKSELLLQGEGD